MIVVVCGVAGAGKTTTGELLAEALRLPFFDADDFHPASNVAKMRSGAPLDDEDRLPWLEALAGRLAVWEQTGGAVLACSALKEPYRKVLGSQCSEQIQWVVLNAPPNLLVDRLASRKGHYFDPELLHSQIDAFELPDYGLHIDVASSPEEVVKNILTRLRGE